MGVPGHGCNAREAERAADGLHVPA
eukprot:COSAG04_NODE_8905_length_918_cov_1.449328_1_plen_24_part_10